jgi:hypothetical protein
MSFKNINIVTMVLKWRMAIKKGADLKNGSKINEEDRYSDQ